jgi:hypothetical protein
MLVSCPGRKVMQPLQSPGVEGRTLGEEVSLRPVLLGPRLFFTQSGQPPASKTVPQPSWTLTALRLPMTGRS